LRIHGGPVLQREKRCARHAYYRLRTHIGRVPQVSTGYLEGIVRGYKAGLLTQGQYANLTQCETLDGAHKSRLRALTSITPASDFRMQLSATDYGNFLANEPTPISTSTISEKATQVLVDQFNYLRSNATEPLSKFLDYLTSACVRSCDVLCLLTRITQVCVHD
jgi:V-type H+-transporting ATPase subunit d